MDISRFDTAPVDLITPQVIDDNPAPGRRVRRFLPEFKGSGIYHTLFLPVDWVADKKYPVIVEYAGNRFELSPGTVEGSNLGYGISRGRGVIWMCLPFIDLELRKNALSWWGDADATVEYCKRAVPLACATYGGDPRKVLIAGFSRGSIACSYIGLRDDEIARLWCGFLCHSHFDGVHRWEYVNSDRESARNRLKRLNGRSVFVSHERCTSAGMSLGDTQAYIHEYCNGGDFTFLEMGFTDHTDSWALRNVRERNIVREWFRKIVGVDV